MNEQSHCRSASLCRSGIALLGRAERGRGNTTRLGWARVARSSLLSLFILGVMAVGAMPAFATHNGGQTEAATLGVCAAARFNATKPASITQLECVANDTKLAIYEVLVGPTSCLEGDVVEVQVRGDFLPTSNERWDVGAFISVDGGTPNSLLTPVGIGNGGGICQNLLCNLGSEDGLSCEEDDGAACETGGGTCDIPDLEHSRPCVDQDDKLLCSANGGTCDGTALCYQEFLHPVSPDKPDMNRPPVFVLKANWRSFPIKGN
jgi:hypothetical protein